MVVSIGCVPLEQNNNTTINAKIRARTTWGMSIEGKKEGLWLSQSKTGHIYKVSFYFRDSLLFEKPFDSFEVKKSKSRQAVELLVTINSYKLEAAVDTVVNRPQGLLINNKKNGLWIDYEDDGRIAVESYYLHNRLEGEAIAYYKPNHVLFLTHAHGGLEDGLFKQFYDNGKLSRVGYYQRGKMIGVWKYYTEDGRLNKKIKYLANGQFKILMNRRLIPDPPKE